MSTATLTSLAILKVNIDQGNDYLAYLQPFILQVLADQKPDPVTDKVVKRHILEQYGLEIPERTVQIILRRLAKRHWLNREQGVYRISGNLPDPGILKKKNEAERHIQAVTSGLIEFSKSTGKLISSPEHAVTAICAFLSEFDISCLRAYLRGTAIPDLENVNNTDIVLVSEYVIHLKQTEPERFESFMVMVQGHMLANALLCPDLQNVPSTYRNAAFYFDTPLLIRRIGIEGEEKLDAIKELIDLLLKLGGNVYAFSHSIDELRNVLISAAEFVDKPNGRGGIVIEARRRGTTKSDLLLLEGQIVDKLKEVGIQIKNTPQYEEDFQIDKQNLSKLSKMKCSILALTPKLTILTLCVVSMFLEAIYHQFLSRNLALS